MEAPDKIYLIRNFSSSTALNTTNDCHEKYLHEWYKSREKDADVEYTRTDVLIKKAIKYIANHFLAPGMDNEINDFANYMKGE